MRDSPLAVAVTAIVLVVICAALSAFVKSRNMVCEVSARSVVADPDLCVQKTIRLKTSGLEETRDSDGNRELSFRFATDKPYILVVRGNIPDPLPEDILCFCEGRDDRGVVILVCQ